MQHAARLLRTAIPLAAVQLGTTALGVVDTAIVGRLDEVALGAVGLANYLYFAVTVLGMGWMLALDPKIAQALGAGERERAGVALWQGVWVAVAGALPIALLVALVAGLLERLGVPEATARAARPYLLGRIPGVAPWLVLLAARSFLQSNELTRPILVSVVVANAINAPLSFLLVFGAPSIALPGLGTAGTGLASSASIVVQLAVVASALRALPGTAPRRPDRREMTALLRFGTPIGLHIAVEVGSFAIVGLLVGRFGTLALGAHNVALTLCSVSFQLALALATASSVHVGKAVGAGELATARGTGLTGVTLIACAMLLSSLAFCAAPELFARILTTDANVIRASVPFIQVGAAFQVADGVQAVTTGALRGAGDSKRPFLLNLGGHYLIGLPVGTFLAFKAGWNAVGLWVGFLVGVSFVAATLLGRFVRLTKRPIARLL